MTLEERIAADWPKLERDLGALLPRHLKSASDIKDAIQETYVRLHRARADVRDLGAYAYTIAVNVAAEIRKARGQCLPFEETKALVAAAADPAPSLEDTCDLQLALAAEIRRLEQSPDHIKLVFDQYADDVPVELIAQQMGVCERTVYRYLKKAKQEFGHLLAYLRGDRK